MISLAYVKGCSHCRLVLPADPGNEIAAGFWVAQRYPDRVRYQAWCKDCQRDRVRAYATRRRRAAGRPANPLVWLGEWEGRMVLFRRCTDCGTDGPCLDTPESIFQPCHQARSSAISWRAQCKDCSNRRRRRSYRRHRRRLRELKRIDAALLGERRGVPLVERKGTVIDHSQPREQAAPFVAWLRAYQRAREIPSARALAMELRLVERRVLALLGGGQRFVSGDTVSRALTEARIVVRVGGRDVVTYDDLYMLPE